MATVNKKNLAFLKDYKGFANPKYKQYVDKVVDLFTQRKIEKFVTAKNILDKLTGRGQGPKTAIGMLSQYEKAESATGKLHHNITKDKQATQFYHVSYTMPVTVPDKKKGSKVIQHKGQYTSNKPITQAEIYQRIKQYAMDNYRLDRPTPYRYDEKETYGSVEITTLESFKPEGLADRKMGELKINYSCISNADKINVNKGQCGIDYLLYELKGKHGFKSLSRDGLIKYFGCEQITTNQIIEFAKQYNTLSVYAVDPLRQVFVKHIAKDARFSLCFIVNNNHLYPIIDPSTKSSVSHANKLILDDYKFNVNYDDIQYIENADLVQTNESKVILFRENEDKDIIKVMMARVMEETELNIDFIKFHNCAPVAFQNPATQQVYEVTSNYYERKRIIDNLTKKYGQSIVRFSNQSYTQIANIIFNNEFGNINQITSNLNKKVFGILDTYKIGPYCATALLNPLDAEEDKTNSFGYDVCKSYSSVLINNNVDFSIFQQFDEVMEFKQTQKLTAGEYYINKQIILCDGLMIYPNGFYPLNFVQFILECGAIELTDITHCILAKQFLKADTFKEFVEHIYTNYPMSDAKQIVNNFIGNLGQKYIRSDKGFNTTSFDIAASIILQYPNDNVTIDTNNDIHFVRVKSSEPKYDNSLSIHRHIICGGIINLVNLYKAIKTPLNRAVAFNTDSIMMKGDLTILENNKAESVCANELANIGKIRVEDWKIKGQDYKAIESAEPFKFESVNWTIENEQDDFNEFCKTINEQQGALICGGAGCGKTEVIKTIRNPETDIILALTNKAVENVISRCGDDVNIQTFDSFFFERLTFSEKLEKAAKYDRFIIEEYSMLSAKAMNLLNIIKTDLGKKMLFFGDNNQCLAIESNNIVYDYIETSTFAEMCNNKQYITSYKKQYSRYDPTTKQYLDHLLKTGKFHSALKSKKDTFKFTNICKSNKTKWAIIEKCQKEFIKQNPTNKTIDLILKKPIQGKTTELTIKFAVGMPLMCIDNLKDLGLYNGTTCSINEINDKIIVIKNGDDLIEFDFAHFASTFEPLFCQTVYKYQGSTISDDYNIYDVNTMSKRELYTSMSRCKSLKNVTFNFSTRTFTNQNNTNAIELKLKISNEIDEKYEEGKIYKITFDNCVYVGSTIQSIEERFAEHIKLCDKPDQALFIEQLRDHKADAKIELIKLYPCASKNELVAEEERHIIEATELKDIICLNTMFKPKISKVKNTDIKMDRLEMVNIETDDDKIKIIENAKQQMYRFQYTDVKGIKHDVKVAYGPKQTRSQALNKIIIRRKKIIDEEYEII